MSSDRIVNRAHPRSAAERDADFYADFDRHAARHEQHAPTLPKGIATQIQADREARRRVGRIA